MTVGKKIKKLELFDIILIVQILLFINYYFTIFGLSYFYKKTLIFIIFLAIFLLYFKIFFEEKLFFFLLVLFPIIALGSPSFHWDARSIWLFHAKKIFFDQNLSYLSENYGNFNFNNYPIFGPSLGASVAIFFGYWNEIFPKLFSFILALPCLAYLNSFTNNKVSKSIFILIILFILEKSFLIGEMDGPLALYYVVSSVIMFKIYFVKNDFFFINKKINVKFLLFCFINFSTLILLKEEGIVYLTIIFSSFYIFKIIINRKFLILKTPIYIYLLSILNLLFWKYILFTNSIYISNHPAISNIFDKTNFNILVEKLFIFKNYFTISEYIFLNKHFFISLILSTFLICSCFFTKNNKLLKKYSNVLLIIFIILFLHYGFLFFVYTITSWDLKWHLVTSASRTTLPISLLISYISLIVAQKMFLFRNKNSFK